MISIFAIEDSLERFGSSVRSCGEELKLLQSSERSCCIKNEQPKKVLEENLRNRFRSLTAERMMPRRLLLQFMGFSPLLAIAQPDFAATGPMPKMKEPEVIQYVFVWLIIFKEFEGRVLLASELEPN
ncbi:hypothetical protein F8388_007966 [Cannabis sativa]|uniref:Uncharacterized protein n=1 Tax=Cannabis sativa TaxID=3483 RepID=A0A7J6FWE0_CANSA|nr:hypothetical protein F8388_007966 [Cannabis sativa]